MAAMEENSGAKTGPAGVSSRERKPLDDGELTRLYEQYGPMVYRRCRSMLKDEDRALDAMQDVFVQLVRNRERVTLDHPSSLLWRMATHVCLNRWRTESRKKEWVVPESFLESTGGTDPSAATEARMLLDDVFATEDEVMRTMAVMYFLEDMTLAEIGQAYDLSISGVRKRLLAFQARARKWHPDPARALAEEAPDG